MTNPGSEPVWPIGLKQQKKLGKQTGAELGQAQLKLKLELRYFDLDQYTNDNTGYFDSNQLLLV